MLTDLFGLFRLEVVCVQQLYVEVFEGFPEARVDFVVHLRQLQELWIHRRDELKAEQNQTPHSKNPQHSAGNTDHVIFSLLRSDKGSRFYEGISRRRL